MADHFPSLWIISYPTRGPSMWLTDSKSGTTFFFFFLSHFSEAVVLDSYSKVIARESG